MEQVIRAFLATLQKTQYMPPEQMRDYQRARLAPLLQHARAHVPFYRDTGRLTPLFRADDSIDWDRWQDIPLLTRKDLQREFERLKADTIPPSHGRTLLLSTSGSTGEPVTIAHTVLSRRIGWIAILLRDFQRHGVDPRRRRVFLAPFAPREFDLTQARRREAWYPEFGALGLPGEQFDLADTRPVNELVDAIVSLRPDYLRVQPLVFELMRAHDTTLRLADIGIRSIMMIGEHLSDELKASTIAQFNCSILEHYGSGECGRMASSCPHCGQLHAHAETVFLEVIDADGAPTAAGNVGRILATPFYNYAMPLIRYDHLDDAQIGSAADCPITLPTLKAIYGKQRIPFIFPGGITIRPVLPVADVVKYLGAQAYQIAQIADDTREFRIVAGKIPPSEMRFEGMTILIRSLWWSGLRVNYRILDQLPRKSPQGKVAMFVREMSQLKS